MERCGWVSQDPLYIAYHDNEWGVPEHDGKKLFEMICLEGQQAGLSWITVLKKRENYRTNFHQFDPIRVAAMQEDDVERLLLDAGIIRHRGKFRPSSAMPGHTWRWSKTANRLPTSSGHSWITSHKSPAPPRWAKSRPPRPPPTPCRKR